MKKIMIALALLGFTGIAADAQTCIAPKKKVVKKVVACKRPVRKTTSVRTAQVCRDEGGYYSCCLTKTRVASIR